MCADSYAAAALSKLATVQAAAAVLLDEKQTELEQTQKASTALQAQLDAAGVACSGKEEAVEQLEGQKAALTKQHAAEVSDLRDRIRNLEGRVDDWQDKCAGLEKNANKKKRKRGRGALEGKKNKKRALEGKKNKKQKNNKKQKKKVKKIQTDAVIALQGVQRHVAYTASLAQRTGPLGALINA
jgi:chromosome segregation ATPase